MRGETNAETSRCAGYDDCAVGLGGHCLVLVLVVLLDW
jgi:hypothetical protein